MIINVFNCRDLLPSDSSGVSDPYIKASYFGIEDKTDTVMECLNPIYNQRIVLENIEIFDEKSMPPLIIKVYDYDEEPFIADDLMGTAIISLK